MPKIEILAPVGSEEMLRAAVFSGADAVYLGFSGFNARTGAGNFDADSLKEAVRFCHARGVKVHVALNTTVYGGELAALAAAVKAVAESGADAVICQDLAVAQLIGRIAPDLPRHGSTQMSVHTLQGALELKELGFTRVVLARELSLPEVEHITKLATPFATKRLGTSINTFIFFIQFSYICKNESSTFMSTFLITRYLLSFALCKSSSVKISGLFAPF